MNRMFAGTSFNQPVGNWDTSKVTDMKEMFERAKEFNQPIGDWDVSQVTSMDDLFHGQKVGKEFNQDISKWDVSKVTNMQYMFFHSAFDQDITGWNTASLPNDRASYRMFTGDGPWYQKYGRVGWSGFGDMNGPPSAWHIKAKAAGT